MRIAFTFLCLLIPMFISACKEQPLTGIYEVSSKSGTVTSRRAGDECKPPLEMSGDSCIEPFMATSRLGLHEDESGNLDFGMSLLFFNAHTCKINGHAKKIEDGWLYEQNKIDGGGCKLLIKKEDGNITFTVLEGSDCRHYCGARGTLERTKFPLSSKTTQAVSGKDDVTCISSMEEPCKWMESKEAE